MNEITNFALLDVRGVSRSFPKGRGEEMLVLDDWIEFVPRRATSS